MKEKEKDNKDFNKQNALSITNCNICILYKKIIKCEDCKSMDKLSMP